MAPKKTGGSESMLPLKEIVADLGPRRITLDKLDLQILNAIQALEERLRARISTRVTTVIETTGTAGGPEWAEILTFGKHDGQWQFLIENGDISDPEDWKRQPLSSASREKRARVFTEGFLEKLVREAAQQLDGQISERKQAVKIAENLIDALGVDDDIPF